MAGYSETDSAPNPGMAGGSIRNEITAESNWVLDS